MRVTDWSQTLLMFVLLLPSAEMVALAEPAPAEPSPFDLTAALAAGPPLTADEAALRAAERAPSVERAEALSRAAEIGVLRARDQLWPRLELGARYAHVDGFPDGKIDLNRDPAAYAMARALADQVVDPAARTLLIGLLEAPSGPNIKMPRDQVALSARLSWPVSDLIFALRPAIAAAEASARVSEAQRVARIARVRLSAREAYYQLARARGALAVAERAREQAVSQEAQIASAVRAGMRPPSDGSSAASRVAAAEQMVASAAAGVDIADAALRTLLSDEDGAVYGITEIIVDDDGAALDAQAPALEAATVLFQRARGKRAEVLALREGISAAQKSARVARAGGYPHVAVFVGGDYARPNRYVIPPSSKMQPSWEVGASLTYAPNDTLNAVRRGRESDAQCDALAADLAELERALTLEIRTARAQLASSVRTVGAARAAQKAAEDAYARRVAELHAGVVTTADLFAAESELNRARLELLDASVGQRLARARLTYAVGD